MKPIDSRLSLTERVRVFADDGRAGNPVAVTLLADAPPSGEAMHSSGESLREPGIPDMAHCLAWPTAAGVVVRCDQDGVPIRCCGHGLLAVAWVWHRHHAAVPLLVNGQQTLLCTIDGSRAWLQLPRPRVVPVPLPPAGAPFPGLASTATATRAPHLVAAAESGGDDGYRILEYAPTLPLDTLALAYTAIAAHDRRALILTQRSTDPRYDYLIRYAAPGYGNDEDAATGSGNVIAATYWSERLQRTDLTGLQTPALPPPLPGLQAGGVLHTRITARHVTIGGELILPERL